MTGSCTKREIIPRISNAAVLAIAMATCSGKLFLSSKNLGVINRVSLATDLTCLASKISSIFGNQAIVTQITCGLGWLYAGIIAIQ